MIFRPVQGSISISFLRRLAQDDNQKAFMQLIQLTARSYCFSCFEMVPETDREKATRNALRVSLRHRFRLIRMDTHCQIQQQFRNRRLQ